MTNESQLFALVPFEARHAEIVREWVLNREDASMWASLDDIPFDSSIFTHWHSDPDVHASILVRDGVPVGYGETWDCDTDEVELARLIVAPSHRGRGIGRILLDRLCAAALAAASKRALLRIRPGNTKALRCYERAGFHRVSSDLERNWNTNQPVEYVWMSRALTELD